MFANYHIVGIYRKGRGRLLLLTLLFSYFFSHYFIYLLIWSYSFRNSLFVCSLINYFINILKDTIKAYSISVVLFLDTVI